MRWVIVLVLLLCGQPANSNPLACRTLADARQFSADNGMTLTWQGIVHGGGMVAEVWQTQAGLWVIAMITPMGVSCLQFYGEGGQLVSKKRDTLTP